MEENTHPERDSDRWGKLDTDIGSLLEKVPGEHQNECRTIIERVFHIAQEISTIERMFTQNIASSSETENEESDSSRVVKLQLNTLRARQKSLLNRIRGTAE